MIYPRFCAVLLALTLSNACTEKTTNPDAITGQEDPFPSTYAPASRMANVAGYRTAWIAAADYINKQEAYAGKQAEGEETDPPLRDLQLETLAEVLRGNILVHNHSGTGKTGQPGYMGW